MTNSSVPELTKKEALEYVLDMVSLWWSVQNESNDMPSWEADDHLMHSIVELEDTFDASGDELTKRILALVKKTKKN